MTQFSNQDSRLFSTTPSCQQVTSGSSSIHGQLVYTGPNNKAVKLVKYFSLSTSALGILCQPYLISQMAQNGVIVKAAIGAFTAFFVFGTPFLLHFICKRYVTKMYYDAGNRTFTATRLNFFAQEKKFTFSADDIRGVTANPLCNFQVGEEMFLLDQDMIRERFPEAYVVWMGYDKPMDISEFIKQKEVEHENKE